MLNQNFQASSATFYLQPELFNFSPNFPISCRTFQLKTYNKPSYTLTIGSSVRIEDFIWSESLFDPDRIDILWIMVRSGFSIFRTKFSGPKTRPKKITLVRFDRTKIRSICRTRFEPRPKSEPWTGSTNLGPKIRTTYQNPYRILVYEHLIWF